MAGFLQLQVHCPPSIVTPARSLDHPFDIVDHHRNSFYAHPLAAYSRNAGAKPINDSTASAAGLGAGLAGCLRNPLRLARTGLVIGPVRILHTVLGMLTTHRLIRYFAQSVLAAIQTVVAWQSF
jgi:hypothetical protein